MGITYGKHHLRDSFWKPLKLAVQFHPVVSLARFRSLLCPSLTGWAWTSYLTSLCLNFLICKMGIIIIISTSYDCNENERSKYYNLLSLFLSLSLSVSGQINRTCHIITFRRCWLPLGKGRNFWTILNTNLVIWALWSLSMGLTIIWHDHLRDWSIPGEVISFFCLTLCLWA